MKLVTAIVCVMLGDGGGNSSHDVQTIIDETNRLYGWAGDTYNMEPQMAGNLCICDVLRDYIAQDGKRWEIANMLNEDYDAQCALK